jgi:cobyrinic acid a,c-diamide synthase
MNNSHNPKLCANNLCVGYGGHPVVENVNFTVNAGEILTLIGSNGSGKSTVLKTITKQLSAISGLVVLDGKNLSDTNAKELATKMSVVLTERVEPELLTCRDVVAMGRYPYTDSFGRLTDEDSRIVDEVLAKVNGAELADRHFDTLSDGQRQRIMLARALCQQPDVMVLDEPTSYLDIRYKIDFMKILRDMADEGITVILSLHEIELARKISDRILCVGDNENLKLGTVDEIFSGDTIEKLFGLEKGTYEDFFGNVIRSQKSEINHISEDLSLKNEFNNLPKILISGASSGSGKTTFTCALLHHLKQMGLRISAFKCGPDYIDPMFHKVVSGVECINIDPFFLYENEMSAKKLISDYSKNADIAVLEGVMGLYDGKNENVDYSTYSVAKMTNSPAIVIINAKGMSLTALALAEGIVNFENTCNVVKGIIFNNMGNAVYNQVLAEYEKRRQTNPLYKNFEIIGHINPLPEELRLESRHLGLITPENVHGVREKISATYEYMKETVDWDRLLELSGMEKSENEILNDENKNLNSENEISNDENKNSDNRPIIAVARDDAFNFYYEENLRALENAGAELVYFSPLADEPVPESASGIYIGGGYPESHLKELSKNENTKNSIRQRIKLHTPIIAECGGRLHIYRASCEIWLCDVDRCL